MWEKGQSNTEFPFPLVKYLLFRSSSPVKSVKYLLSKFRGQVRHVAVCDAMIHADQTEIRAPKLSSSFNHPGSLFLEGKKKKITEIFSANQWVIKQKLSGSDGKESACHAGDEGSIPGSGRSLGGGHDSPLRYSCLENRMDRGAWGLPVHRVSKIGHHCATNTFMCLLHVLSEGSWQTSACIFEGFEILRCCSWGCTLATWSNHIDVVKRIHDL